MVVMILPFKFFNLLSKDHRELWILSASLSRKFESSNFPRNHGFDGSFPVWDNKFLANSDSKSSNPAFYVLTGLIQRVPSPLLLLLLIDLTADYYHFEKL
eukprot:m.75189 g.75189  ORF g.75189 m.75189 type:complete len:100 (-) comp20492_c0_seq5:55-354(-)